MLDSLFARAIFSRLPDCYFSEPVFDSLLIDGQPIIYPTFHVIWNERRMGCYVCKIRLDFPKSLSLLGFL
jgi:hypothetical protein